MLAKLIKAMCFVNDFKSDLVNVNENNFGTKALQLFEFQYFNNYTYRKYVDLLSVNIKTITAPEKIPFLPITFFKDHKIVSTSNNYNKYFESSGTTTSQRSKLYYYDEEFYLKNARQIFENFFGDTSNYSFFFLLPNYLERSNSSLVSMANYFYSISDKSSGGFFLNDFDNLYKNLVKALEKKESNVILWGVTFALMDFAEIYPGNFENLTIVETGGMKGRGKEPLRDEVHEILKSQLKANAIHSEYGMTELFSQAYALRGNLFKSLPIMKVFIREVEDSLSVHADKGIRGGVNIIDLANVDTCAFIETQDVGVLQDGGFQILGRYDNAEIRGCNLLIL